MIGSGETRRAQSKTFQKLHTSKATFQRALHISPASQHGVIY